MQSEVLLYGMPGFMCNDGQIRKVRGLIPGDSDHGDREAPKHGVPGAAGERFAGDVFREKSFVAGECVG